MDPETECENVTVKVPANLLRLLEEKGFFGKTRDEWFNNAILQGVNTELDNLAFTDHVQVRTLENKYGLDQPFFSERGE